MNRLIASVLLLMGGSGFAQDTILTKEIDGVEVQIYLPPQVKTYHGLIVHAANYKLKDNDRWAELCNQLQFGHVALNIPNVQKATNRGAKLAKAYEDGLKEFAKVSGHPELTDLHAAGTGHSAGGLVTGLLLKNPDKTITNCIDCGWVMDPDKHGAAAAQVPALFTIGAIPDNFKMLPSIEQFYEPARKRNLPWALGLQWGCAHDFGNTAALAVPWIHACAELRLPKAGKGPLNAIKLENGWLGDRKTIESNNATVSPWGEYKGEKSAAVWLPNEYTAKVWRAYQSKFPKVTLQAESADGKVKLAEWNPKKSRDLMLDQGDVKLSFTADKKMTVEKISYFDGHQFMATVVPGQMAAQVTLKPGYHVVWAEATTKEQGIVVTTPSLMIVRMKGK